jgi:hypothetical protein
MQNHVALLRGMKFVQKEKSKKNTFKFPQKIHAAQADRKKFAQAENPPPPP